MFESDNHYSASSGSLLTLRPALLPVPITAELFIHAHFGFEDGRHVGSGCGAPSPLRRSYVR